MSGATEEPGDALAFRLDMDRGCDAELAAYLATMDGVGPLEEDPVYPFLRRFADRPDLVGRLPSSLAFEFYAAILAVCSRKRPFGRRDLPVPITLGPVQWPAGWTPEDGA